MDLGSLSDLALLTFTPQLFDNASILMLDFVGSTEMAISRDPGALIAEIYVYDIFGPGVNLAARMESLSEPMRITISEPTYQLIKNDFVCTERGEFEVKGFDTQVLYFLERELPHGR